MSAGIIILLILALLLVIFTLQNSTSIDLKIFFWELADVPLVLALLICIITGFLIAYLVQYSKLRKLRKELKNTQIELEDLTEKMDAQEPISSEGIEIEGENEKGFFSE